MTWRRYRLERDDGTCGDFDYLAYSGPETSAAVCGLRSGAQYRFRLWAFNEVPSAPRLLSDQSQEHFACCSGLVLMTIPVPCMCAFNCLRS